MILIKVANILAPKPSKTTVGMPIVGLPPSGFPNESSAFTTYMDRIIGLPCVYGHIFKEVRL